MLVSWAQQAGVACLSTAASLKPTVSMVVLGEKLRRVPWATQPGREVELGELFLRSSRIRATLLTTSERMLYADKVRYVLSSAIHAPTVEIMWHVDQVSPARCLSIQITTTLRYE
jgi:hypothetical protein